MATTAKGLSKAEMKLLSEFTNTVNAREITENVDIKKLTLSFDTVNGFVIDLVEVPKGQTVTETE